MYTFRNDNFFLTAEPPGSNDNLPVAFFKSCFFKINLSCLVFLPSPLNVLLEISSTVVILS